MTKKYRARLGILSLQPRSQALSSLPPLVVGRKTTTREAEERDPGNEVGSSSRCVRSLITFNGGGEVRDLLVFDDRRF